MLIFSMRVLLLLVHRTARRAHVHTYHAIFRGYISFVLLVFCFSYFCFSRMLFTCSLSLFSLSLSPIREVISQFNNKTKQEAKKRGDDSIRAILLLPRMLRGVFGRSAYRVPGGAGGVARRGGWRGARRRSSYGGDKLESLRKVCHARARGRGRGGQTSDARRLHRRAAPCTEVQ